MSIINTEATQRREVIDAIKARLLASSLFLYREHRDLLGNELSSQNYALHQARKELQKLGIYFAPLTNDARGQGLKKLDNDGLRDGLGRRRLKSYRAIGRAQKIGAAVDESKLAASERPKHWATLATLAAVKSQLHGNAINAKAERTQQSSVVEKERKRLATTLSPNSEPETA